MPIPLKQKIQKTSKVVRLEGAPPDKNKNWLTWWYCGIYKNQKADSQPNALVAFRELLESGELSDEVAHRRVPLTALGQVRIGTVWRDGLCRSEVIYETQNFSIDFTKKNWSLTSFHKTHIEESSPPYPPEIYPLKYRKDYNWLLEFNLKNGGKLIVPCLEFFTRCYGRSAELRRVLATYSWEDCQEKRLYSPLDEPEEQNKWKVKLRKRLVNGDITFLAHAKYEKYTENAAKSIYSQIESNYDPQDEKPAFIKVAPWFRGPAELKVKGVWFDNGKSFLALQIVGCSEPAGAPILRGRENANNAEQPEESGAPGNAWAGTPERTLIKPPDIIDLTGDVEPDPHAAPIEFEDPDFEILGSPRIIIDMKKERAQSSSGQKVKGADVSAFSSGEPQGRGQGVGYASIHARPTLESQGTLRDMWNAILFLREKRPDLIQSVEWFTFEDGYQKGVEPRLIMISPFDESDELDNTTRKWPYIETTAALTFRGALIARILVKDTLIHILEIQRRPQKKKDSSGNIENSEESFKGLVFSLDNQDDIERWLKKLLSAIRYVKGVVQKLTADCPGRAAAFKHSAASNDEVPCEAAVLNALGKMGVAVSA